MGTIAKVTNGRERWDANRSVPRHRHDQPYAAIVLAGSYEECGSHGRFRVEAGDVLLHAAFDAHLDRFRQTGAQILNLVLERAPDFAFGHVRDHEAIEKAAERDVLAASVELHAQMTAAEAPALDWPDLLARDLLDDPDCRLDDWAQAHNLAAETVSRGFGKMFGVTPAAFRLEVRARRAFSLIAGSATLLASIAVQTGFADQAHMSRAVRALTGVPPGRWRRSNPFKTELARAA
jgi:AraC-like DNA-binding protein